MLWHDRVIRLLDWGCSTARNVVKFFPVSDPLYFRLIDRRSAGYTDANPFELRWVSPEAVEYCSLRSFTGWSDVGRVLGGDWDRSETRFEEASFDDEVQSSMYRAFRAHFVDGLDWAETAFVREVKELCSEGRQTWGCGSPEELREKCERLDEMFESLRRDGYRTHEEHVCGDGRFYGRSPRNLLKCHTFLRRDEVVVDIGRDGEIIFHDGKHRLGMAKLLDADQIPVCVAVRHAEWQSLRDELASNVRSVPPKDHPDIVV